MQLKNSPISDVFLSVKPALEFLNRWLSCELTQHWIIVTTTQVTNAKLKRKPPVIWVKNSISSLAFYNKMFYIPLTYASIIIHIM
jgi:hypothetical protein